MGRLSNVKVVTLTNLAESTEQEVFDHVVKHLLIDQQDVCVVAKSCAYRGKIGDKVLKCAAGALISDEEWENILTQVRAYFHKRGDEDGSKADNAIEKLNLRSWTVLTDRDYGYGPIVPKAHETLIYKLQGLHDSAQYCRHFGKRAILRHFLKHIRENFNYDFWPNINLDFVDECEAYLIKTGQIDAESTNTN